MSAKKSLMYRLSNVPHQVIGALTLIVIALPYLMPVGIPLKITPYSEQFKAALDAVPEGGNVAFSLDSAMGGTTETGGMIRATIKYFIYDRPDVHIVMWGMHYDCVLVFNTFVADVLEDADYGKEVAWFGYIPGTDAAIAKLSDDLKGILSVDFYGTPVAQLEIMDNINGAPDFDLLLSFDTYGHADSYVGHWYERYKTKIAIGMLSGSIPVATMRFTAGQIVGFCGGVKGAAELEALLKYPGPAYTNYDVMNVANLFAIGLLLFGNITYFLTKKEER